MHHNVHMSLKAFFSSNKGQGQINKTFVHFKVNKEYYESSKALSRTKKILLFHSEILPDNLYTKHELF